MGFTDNYTSHAPSISTRRISVSSTTSSASKDGKSTQNASFPFYPLNLCDDEDDTDGRALIPDQEILDSIEEVYFQADVKTGVYELNVSEAKIMRHPKQKYRVLFFFFQKFIEEDMDVESVQRAMLVLKQQHKVISKKVMQKILDKRTPCNTEIDSIQETNSKLKESLLECQKARSYLSCARKNLATTNLQILATYKKREILQEILAVLQKLKKLKSTENQLQKLLDTNNYSGAISLLLECKRLAAENRQFVCVDALAQKLQDTQLLVELQLENVLGEMTQNFDACKYSNLQEAFRLLGKSFIAMDQLHMNFVSAIHSTAFNVLLGHSERQADAKQKYLFEELCDKVSAEKLIPCLLQLCKSFWCILVCYYQIAMWHQNPAKLSKLSMDDDVIDDHKLYTQQKFKAGYSRLWNEVQSKMAAFINNSTKLHTLKYEQFIQVLSIVQRLRKVGVEFCNETSIILMDAMRNQSTRFFERYHLSCLDEISLFIDNEAWMPVHSFTSLIQLQEFNAVKNSLKRFFAKQQTNADDQFNGNDSTSTQSRRSPSKKADRKKSTENLLNQTLDETISLHSQEDCGSSVYGSCGYFLRFSEKSSPFDGGFDVAMLEEDILAGIADESSCYFSEESESDQQNGDSNGDEDISLTIIQNKTAITVNNSSLNVLRCIGRYLQMCRLLHSISPQIVKSMTELIEFYIFAVHELFAKDSPLSNENVYSSSLANALNRIEADVILKVKNWPPSKAIVS